MHITAQYLSKGDSSFFLLSLPITCKVTKSFVNNEQVSTSPFVPEREREVLFVHCIPQKCLWHILCYFPESSRGRLLPAT